MRFLNLVVGGFMTAAIVACTGAPPVDLKAEEAKLRDVIRRWLEADTTRNIEAAVAFYADDAVELPSNTPAVFGKDRIRSWYKTWLTNPSVTLTFSTETIDVATAGDVACERGTYRFVTDGPAGKSEDVGKYLTFWKKVNGEWKVAADINNSDLPVPGS